MKEKILLTIDGVQTDSEGAENQIRFVTEGTLTQGDYGTELRYIESEIVGTDGAEMVIRLADGAVAVCREGDYASHFLFRQGDKCLNLYQTPFGMIELGAYPTQVLYAVREDGGEVELRYELEVQGRFQGSNQLRLQWKSPIS